MHTDNNLIENIFDWQHGAVPATNTDIRGNITADNLMILVSDIIIQLGIPVHVKGYTYLREAIIIKVNDPQADMPVTKILYPDVAKKFYTSAGRVERAIRHAIEMAWTRMDCAYREQNFSYRLIRFEKKPTNSEFIAMIAEYIVLLYS